MAKETKYKLVLIIEGTLSAEQKQDLAESMASEATMALCDMRGGDSGGVRLEFVGG